MEFLFNGISSVYRCWIEEQGRTGVHIPPESRAETARDQNDVGVRSSDRQTERHTDRQNDIRNDKQNVRQ